MEGRGLNIVFDIDGTICFDGQIIAQELLVFLEQINQQKTEHQLIFASARPVRDILPLLPPSLQQCHLIGGNGSMLYYQKKLQWFEPLDSEVSAFVLAYIQEHQLDYLIDEAWNYAYHGSTLNALKAKIDVWEQAVNLPLDQLTNPLKILVANYFDQEQLLADFAHLNVECIAYSKENCVDLIKKGVNKANALAKIIQDKDYLAFGNDANDFELLNEAKWSVCIGDNQTLASISQYQLPAKTESIINLMVELLA